MAGSKKDHLLDRLESGYSLRVAESNVKGVSYLLDTNSIGIMLNSNAVAVQGEYSIVCLTKTELIGMVAELQEFIELYFRRNQDERSTL